MSLKESGSVAIFPPTKPQGRRESDGARPQAQPYEVPLALAGLRGPYRCYVGRVRGVGGRGLPDVPRRRALSINSAYSGLAHKA
jgi:hypothetical protein